MDHQYSFDQETDVIDGHTLEIRSKEPTVVSESSADVPSLEKAETGKKSATAADLDATLAHLPEEEARILKEQLLVEPVNISYFSLYRYANKKDLIIIFFAYLSSIITGALLPLFTIIFGGITQTFTDFFVNNGDPNKFQDKINWYTLFYLYLGLGIMVFTYLETFLHVDRGEVLAARIRQHYLKAILRQNIAYFDKLGAGEVTNRITTDTNLIQAGISEKAGLIVTSLSTFIAAFVIGFIRSWKLTLILSSVVVSIALLSTLCSKFIIKYTVQSIQFDAESSSLAEEVFSAIRNTVAFGSQNRLLNKYDIPLTASMKSCFKKGYALGFMIAGMWFILYTTYALAFWQGSRFIVSGETNVGAVTTCVMAIMIGAFSIGNVAPNVQAIGTAVGSAKKVFETIDRVTPIDASSDQGKKLDNIQGLIELKNLKFIYPSRPNVTILENMNLTINPGQTVALVGASGSGKSTIIGLIERFYSAVGGQLCIDGHDVNDLNVAWLRQQIALVSQEPTLFACSIYENIAYGLIGTPYENASDEKKRELIIDACKMANAYDFILSMTDGFETNVGDRGFLMSGGQKQRIAIARAIVSQPKILLLDEATSALDTKSEGVVQEALDRAAKNRTTIVIAHRLSTIKDADLIVVMSKGKIVEQGTHADLLERGQAYHALVEAQKIKQRNQKAAMGNMLNEDHMALEHLTQKDPDSPITFEGKSAIIEDEENNLGLAKTQTSKSVSSIALAAQKVPATSTKHSVYSLAAMLFKLNYNERYLIYIGCTAAIVCGLGYPSMSILFAKVMSAFMVPVSEYAQMRRDMNKYSGFFFLVACVEFIAFIIMMFSLITSCEILTKKIRLRVFKHVLRMDIAFFDKEENSSGALSSSLMKDAQDVQGLAGATLGQIMNSLVTLVAGIIVALAINWRLGLVCMACVPLLIGCGFLRYWLLTMLQERAKKAYSRSGSYACENTSAIRTVISLTREYGVWETYCHQIDEQVRLSRISVAKSSILYGVSQGLAPFIMGLAFWYGTTLLKNYTITQFQFFVAFIAIVFGAQAAGTIFSFAPDMGKAKQAASSIANLFAIKPEIDIDATEGINLTSEQVQGNIEFRDVHFRYPTRPQVPVLKGLNLTIKKGQYVALVGSSGCGKSTTISLVEHFYKPLSGQVLLDDININELNVSSYRSHIALVQQEPVLYSGTIKDNILLGTSNDDEVVSDEDLYAASRKANIHDFIMSLPDQYDTLCGSKGALLSGGQKQRVAIARALIRNPKILLLDEATSALDSESEKVVQEALDAAAKGRTTIAVAHRLSTIQNADIIYVFEAGKVIEQGTHMELLDIKGKYYELVKMQALES
ncbi:P-loop containing nucleoside triphosphate hydrolase protein [Nadsonia fulvescens var. elongata DSM 6958]|uniref:p-loop containing nucleoside triphosphate hydrolase protein n=1 Tax=Nadsonia fulvescens var. elongata DSM 6958 TaxID=857566 RepID=A0A1E3PRN7_9ASCO|nr:P-loop containing nucleoside triphosphate hydrolase protein [Nadsonia fulvescens var. elongata DSM 6958]